MKKWYYIGLIGIVLLISGCTQQAELGKGSTSYYTFSPPTDHSYLKDVIASPFYVGENQDVIIDFTVVNPTKQAIEHNVELRFDLNNCFRDNTIILNIEKDGQKPSSITTTVIRLYGRTDCIGTRTVTVVLLDTNDELIDYSNILINIKE